MFNADVHTIPETASIKSAVKKMDRGGIGIVLCIDDAKNVRGLITDGDFRRAVLNSVSLDVPVSTIMNRNFISLPEGYNPDEAAALFKTTPAHYIPVVRGSKIIDLISEENLVRAPKTGRKKRRGIFPANVVIMAGGFGTRLSPLTYILTKPLIPIGQKPIIEIIIDKFVDVGAREFYLSVNYKSRLIKSYFEELDPSYKVNYIYEDKPLGTAGSLKNFKDRTKTILVSNCDIIVNIDYRNLIEFHKKHSNDITIVASLKHFVIPYGVCEIGQGGELTQMNEKPEFSFFVNTGMYVLNPKILRLIPKNRQFHMTDLIETVKSKNARVVIYPINENAWIDIGEWSEYKKAIGELSI